MTNFAQMMQKAHKFKQQMQEMQARVQATDVAGDTAGGLVTCVMTGKFELRSIKLDPAVVKADEKDVLEDLIVAAVNDARAKAEKLMADETSKLMKEMGLPPGLDLPF